MVTHSHPYSIYVWIAPMGRNTEGSWEEVARVYTQEYATYLANLIYNDSKCVLRACRYGVDFACFPSKEAVERVDKVIASKWPHNQLFTHPRYKAQL